MLRFETDLFCIPAEESDVMEVYRSKVSVRLDSADYPLDAFVCCCREESKRRIFAAFHQKKLRRTLVYSLYGAEEDALAKALAFTRDLGFEMEELNLDFGQAMRQVMLRQIPVLLRPESAERLERERIAELEGLKRLAAGPQDGEEDSASERKSEAAQAVRKLALEERHAAAMDAIRRNFDRRLLDLNAPAVMAAAEQDLRALQLEKERLEARCLELQRAAAKEAAEAKRSTARVTDLEAEIAEARGQMEKVQQKAAAVEIGTSTRISELEAALAEARREATVARSATEGRQSDLENALAEAERRAAQKVAGVEFECRERMAALEETLSTREEELERLRGERDRLKEASASAARREAELEEALNRRSEEAAGEENRRIEDLEQALAKVREELEAERFERELLLREKWLAERRLTEIADSERIEAPEEEPKSSDASKGEVDKRIGSLTEALGMAEERVSYLRDALEGMAAEKEPKEASAPDAAPRKGAGKRRLAPIRLGPSDGERESSLSEESTEIPPHGRRRSPRRGAFFHPEWDRVRIEYEHPEDILAVYQSAGMVQLSLEGCPNQFCSAYIVTRKQGEQRQVHIIFELSESRRNLVYSPVKPLRSREDYDQALHEAFKFLQVVGYSVEQLTLGETGEQRGKALAQIDILSGPRPRAQGF